MLRNRQSSETPGALGLMYSLVHRPAPADLSVWMHAAPKAFAARGSAPHFTGGFGGAHRSSPTGGAANGTPRNALTPLSVVPTSTPCTTVARGSASRAAMPKLIAVAAATRTASLIV